MHDLRRFIEVNLRVVGSYSFDKLHRFQRCLLVVRDALLDALKNFRVSKCRKAALKKQNPLF
jgi:hypothetical protein